MVPTDPPSAAASAADAAAPEAAATEPCVASATVASPTAATGQVKRSRTSLSIHEKSIVKSFCEQQLQACKARGEPGAPSHDTLRREIVAQFGWDVGRSTLSKILTMDWALLQGSAHRNPHMKRKRRPLFPVFEAELVQFISAQLSPATLQGGDHSSAGAETASDALATPDGGSRRALKTHSLTEAMILEEAQRLKQLHGIKDEELVLSVGWLARFKHRNGIRLRKAAPHGNAVDSKKMASHELSLAASSISTSCISALNETDTVIPQAKRYKLEAAIGNDEVSVKTSTPDTLESKTLMKYSAVCGAVRSSDRPPSPAWLTPIYEQIPLGVRRLGCVCDPIVPVGITGLSVVVIGFGSVIEAYVASALVGAEGFVTCLGCSPDDIAVGMEHMDAYAHSLGYATPNMRFIPMSPALLQPSTLSVFPELEGLQLEDLVIFNCSFHSVPIQVFALELAYTMLKEGGELLFVDTYCSRRLQPPRSQASAPHEPIQLSVESSPEASTDTSVDAAVSSASASFSSALSHSRADQQLLHATYEEDIRRTCQQIGFLDIRRISEIHVFPQDPSLEKELAARFTMVTIRAFKLKSIDDRAEDYGQTAVYNGGLAQCPLRYELDINFVFDRAEPTRVDGNTAEILSSSWLRRFFTVTGDRSTHFGRFDSTQTLLRVDSVSVDALAV